MKRIAFAAAGLCALASPAAAGDSVPNFDWNGLYFGVQGGLAGGSFDYPATIDIPLLGGASLDGSIKDDSMGGFGGVTAGYNWMVSPNVLVGVETDISAAGIDGSLGLSAKIDTPLGGGGFNISGGSKVNWFGSTRLRAGWVDGPLLLYATGGVAYGETESYYKASATGLGSAKDSVSSTSTGWTAGFGAEYAINPAWTLKTEYAYYDLGKENLVSIPEILGPGSSLNLSRETTFHTVKAGLNYHWDANGAGGAALALPAADWTGGYVGVFGGLAGGSFDYPVTLAGDLMLPITAKATISDDSQGGFGGVGLGYDWQVSPNVVVGVATDIAGADIDGSLGLTASASGGMGGGGRLNIAGGSKVNWFGTTRARAGWATGPLLLYATGGLAYGETESYYTASATGLGSTKDSVSSTSTGWAAGAGAEYMLNPHWTLSTEYLYVDLGKENLVSLDNILGSGASLDLSRETTFHTVKAGVNYRW